MQIPPPCDPLWSPYKKIYLPLLLLLLGLVCLNFAVSIVWVISVSHFSGVFSTLIFTAISFLVVGYWIYIYFKGATRALWTLVVFAISALWAAGSFAGNAEWQTKCHKKCALHGFLTAIGAAHMLTLFILTFLAFRVWRTEKSTGGAARSCV